MDKPRTLSTIRHHWWNKIQFPGSNTSNDSKPGSNVINQQSASSSSVITPCHTAEPLLEIGVFTKGDQVSTTGVSTWPAVSQICSLTVFPPTGTILLPNSTPIVCALSSLNWPSINWGGIHGKILFKILVLKLLSTTVERIESYLMEKAWFSCSSRPNYQELKQIIIGVSHCHHPLWNHHISKSKILHQVWDHKNWENFASSGNNALVSRKTVTGISTPS